MDTFSGADPGSLAKEPGWPGWVSREDEVEPGLRAALARPLRRQDLAVPWQLDFHHPRGVLPLGVHLLDTMATASVQAARRFGLGVGFAARLVGCHPYFGPAGSPEAPRTTPWRFDPVVTTRLDAFAERFRTGWAADSRRLVLALERLEALSTDDLAEAGAEAIGDYLARALAVHRDAWQVHFDTMYPLLALLRRFLVASAELGVPNEEAVGLLHGERTSVMDVDDDLRVVAEVARRLDVVAPGGSDEEEWRRVWGDFLSRHGRRGQAGADLGTASWVEDPRLAWDLLEQVRNRPGTRRIAPSEADVELDRILPGLTPAARTRFRALVEDVRTVNFAWWSEEHNLVIDLRAHLPVRTAGLAAGRLFSPEDPELALFLHTGELLEVLSGGWTWSEVAEVAVRRRDYVRSWQRRRETLPTMIGARRRVDDLVLQEVFGVEADPGGLDPEHPGEDQGDPPVLISPTVSLSGRAVSMGTARGPARVLRDVVDLPLVRAGEVLVCEATSPAWTPVFDRVAGCVCVQGGLLTHAAIIAREFGVPAVCAVASATTLIHDGDLVEVDAVLGEVRVWTGLSGIGDARENVGDPSPDPR